MMENEHLSAPAVSKSAYRELADAGTEILRSLPIPEVIAIEALHFRNSHPNSLKVFQNFLHRPRQRDLLKAILKGLWHNAVSVLVGGIGKRADGRGKRRSEKIDILFVSHSLNGNSGATAKDLYFGDLPEQLKAFGYKSATVLINHSENRKAQTSTLSELDQMILPKSLGRWGELNITARVSRAFWALQTSRFADDAQARLAKYASWTAFSPSSRSALRIGAQIGDLIKELDPTSILITYEGHSWERLAFRRARDLKPGIGCLAYAHAPLFPMHHALTVELGHGYDPDILFVPGEAALHILQTSKSMNGRDLRVLGSARASNSAPLPGSSKRSGICLLLPEGLISEVRAVLDLCASTAPRVPNIRFRIRMHPVLTREMFLEKAPDLRELPENIEWSQGASLQEDLEAAEWAVYRGSSAIVAAPAAEVRPIYYRLPDEQLSIDPLFGLGPYRQVVESEEDLIRVLLGGSPLPEKDRTDAKRFCETYYQPMNPEILAQALSHLGRN